MLKQGGGISKCGRYVQVQQNNILKAPTPSLASYDLKVPRPSSPEQNLLAQIETLLVRLINNRASSYLSSFGA